MNLPRLRPRELPVPPRLTCSLSHLLLFVWFACFAGSAQTATFTTPITIHEGDATYDGLDIVVDGTTVTINGPHTFNSLLLTNGAVLTHSACSTVVTEHSQLEQCCKKARGKKQQLVFCAI